MSTEIIDTDAASAVPDATGDAARGKRDRAVRKQVRGSSLLLAGRLLSKSINFGTHVLIVRCLSEQEFGLFGVALQAVALVQACCTFGLDRAITRYLPIYHEREEWGKLFGTVMMVFAAVLSLGMAVTLAFNLLYPFLPAGWIKDERAIPLLMVLLFLAPIQALDELMVGLFAVFASPRAIFFRKHLLGPGLKLTGVLVTLVLLGGSLQQLTFGYLAASIIGTSVCLAILFRLVKRQNLLAHFDRCKLQFPWREVLAFTVPLLSSELVYVVMYSIDVWLLERYGSVSDVAAIRSVQPLSLFNQIVMASFATLFMPTAARLFARGDQQGINELYWKTAAWIAVFSFPIFALTFSLAEPMSVFCFGETYRSSWILLALLSLGHYFNAALGFNGLTLKVTGRLKFVVAINLLAAACHLGLAMVLIPRYGAIGAACGSCASLVLHNIFKQIGLVLGTGIKLLEPRYLRTYGIIATAALGLAAMQYFVEPPLYVGLPLAAAVSLAVLRLNRDLLDADNMFPELRKSPLVGRLLGQKSAKTPC